MSDLTPPIRHLRDCLYVTSEGPAPCTCGFYQRDAGWRARMDGLPYEANPLGGHHAAAWADGWRDADRALRNAHDQ